MKILKIKLPMVIIVLFLKANNFQNHDFLVKDDHFVLHDFFWGKCVVWDESYKTQDYMKKQRLAKVTKIHVIITLHFETLKNAFLKD